MKDLIDDIMEMTTPEQELTSCLPTMKEGSLYVNEDTDLAFTYDATSAWITGANIPIKHDALDELESEFQARKTYVSTC